MILVDYFFLNDILKNNSFSSIFFKNNSSKKILRIDDYFCPRNVIPSKIDLKEGMNEINSICKELKIKHEYIFTREILSKKILLKKNEKFPFSNFEWPLDFHFLKRKIHKHGQYKTLYKYDFSSFYGNLMVNNKFPIPPYWISNENENSFAIICDVDESNSLFPFIPERINGKDEYLKRKKENAVVFDFDINRLKILETKKFLNCEKRGNVFDFVKELIKKRKNEKLNPYYKILVNWIHWSLHEKIEYIKIDDGIKMVKETQINQVIDEYLNALGRSVMNELALHFLNNGQEIIHEDIDSLVTYHDEMPATFKKMKLNVYKLKNVKTLKSSLLVGEKILV